MLVDESRLHIAVQKAGRLSDYSRGLLRDAGLRIQNGRNELAARVENFPADLMFVRDDDIPTFVADGVCEFGMVGENVLREFALGEAEERVEVVAPLGFGRCTLKLAAPESTAWAGPASLAGARIATSYPRIVRRWLADNGVAAEVVRMSGAVELAPRLGIAGFVCDLVSTGATLEANGLAALATVFDSEAVLIRTRKPVAEAKRAQGERLLSRIEGVLATKESKYKMLGICLGMQLLYEASDEEKTECLGLIAGRVRRLEPAPGRPVPHMGWSRLEVADEAIGLATGDYVYFAHGFACDDGPATLARADYGRPIPAVVRSGNFTGAQFHPERSAAAGARFLKAWLAA